MSTSIGIVGARGYVGAELIRLIAAHPQFELAFVSSRELVGQRVADHFAGVAGIDPELRYTAPSNDELPSLGADAVVLALPNGKAAACVAAFDAAGADPVIIDLSADYRFGVGSYAAFAGATMRYVAERNASFDGSVGMPQYRLPDYTALDLRGGVTLGSARLQLYCRNVGDERGQLSAMTGTSPLGGPANVSMLQPRTIGLSLDMTF